MWKQVMVTTRNCFDTAPRERNFSKVAGIRETDGFLVIRCGAFPNEVITKIKLSEVVTYICLEQISEPWEEDV